MAKSKNNIKIMITRLITTIFFFGYFPIFPGTVGSFLGLIIYSLVYKNPAVYFLITFMLVILGFLYCGKAEYIFRKKDCKKIIIDDLCGQLVSLLFIPFSLNIAFLGFILFRAFDGLKVYPSKKIERFHGSLGIMGDDILAGIYANTALRILLFFNMPFLNN
ncbi:MAG: phosphatidylglycerophosphatase A [Candidatus Omnitrophota bacterium]